MFKYINIWKRCNIKSLYKRGNIINDSNFSDVYDAIGINSTQKVVIKKPNKENFADDNEGRRYFYLSVLSEIFVLYEI
jgi:hypothetical protein